jgi:hypothetical protein
MAPWTLRYAVKKLPKSCEVLIPKKGSKTVTIKCSSARAANEVRKSLYKLGPSAKGETQSEKIRKGKNPFIVAACVVSVIEKSLERDGRRKAQPEDVRRAFAICRSTLSRSGSLRGAALTAKGKERDAEKRKAAGADKVHDTFKRLDKYLAQARGY